jgi:protein O-GlcNAc transferase
MISVPQAFDLAWKHLQAGRWQHAEQIYQQILQVDASHVDALQLLGTIAAQTGRDELAMVYLNRALRLKPDSAAAHNNLGNVFSRQRRFAEAVACFRQAVRLKPDHAEPHNNLGNALRDQGHVDEAVASLEQAVRLRPDSADARYNLGHALKDQGRLDDAIAAYRTALELKPDGARIHTSLIGLLHYHYESDARAIHEECRQWDQRHAQPLKKLWRPHTNLPDPDRRLRVGYVSPDFCEHVDSFFTVPLLSNHDHRQFEIYCYSEVTRPDAVTERLRGYADTWRSTLGISDQVFADMIRSDQIDILVDLKMQTAYNRLLVFARKPAPVQVAWLGYTGTTGLSAIDYRLTDPYLDPPELFDAFYMEESVRLPETFWCYDPLTDQPAVNILPALERGFITFGCLNNFCKVNDGCLALWAQVLRAVPRSRLLLLAPRGHARDHVLARLEQEGVAASRVDFAERQPRLDYLKTYHQIDLGLDPVPCNGHSTSLDAFWMGVPTLTLVSTKSAFGRAGWSQLCNLGLKELAAETPEQYVALAVDLAADLPRLAGLRSTLRQRMEQSPLMNGDRFARNVEQAYRHVWCRWCEGKRPDRE